MLHVVGSINKAPTTAAATADESDPPPVSALHRCSKQQQPGAWLQRRRWRVNAVGDKATKATRGRTSGKFMAIGRRRRAAAENALKMHKWRRIYVCM